ncbi:DUF6069 family protein [Umezawaea sp.]|uniref:DUF6069 family protein n=1 Tax=Umezawaea sp. TaxID=1955258 RepID=UPI002ED191E8
MTKTTDTTPRPLRPAFDAGTVVGGVVLAALASVAVNSVIATIASSALPPGGTRMGLELQEYASLTVVGILLGALAWFLVRRHADNPRAVLRYLVPAAVLLSLVPDFGILMTGVPLLNALALVAMHLAVAAITVPTLAKVLPLPLAEA